MGWDGNGMGWDGMGMEWDELGWEALVKVETPGLEICWTTRQIKGRQAGRRQLGSCHLAACGSTSARTSHSAPPCSVVIQLPQLCKVPHRSLSIP